VIEHGKTASAAPEAGKQDFARRKRSDLGEACKTEDDHEATNRTEKPEAGRQRLLSSTRTLGGIRGRAGSATGGKTWKQYRVLGTGQKWIESQIRIEENKTLQKTAPRGPENTERENQVLPSGEMRSAMNKRSPVQQLETKSMQGQIKSSRRKIHRRQKTKPDLTGKEIGTCATRGR
jgi:hypothetical protein